MRIIITALIYVFAFSHAVAERLLMPSLRLLYGVIASSHTPDVVPRVSEPLPVVEKKATASHAVPKAKASTKEAATSKVVTASVGKGRPARRRKPSAATLTKVKKLTS